MGCFEAASMVIEVTAYSTATDKTLTFFRITEKVH